MVNKLLVTTVSLFVVGIIYINIFSNQEKKSNEKNFTTNKIILNLNTTQVENKNIQNNKVLKAKGKEAFSKIEENEVFNSKSKTKINTELTISQHNKKKDFNKSMPRINQIMKKNIEQQNVNTLKTQENIKIKEEDILEDNKILSLNNKEMEKNEKEIIRKSLEEKEILNKRYNLEEEDNIPEKATSFQDEEEYEEMSLEELDKIEKENNLQPQTKNVFNIQSDLQENISITAEELDNAEKEAGLQEIIEDNSKPLEKEDIPLEN